VCVWVCARLYFCDKNGPTVVNVPMTGWQWSRVSHVYWTCPPVAADNITIRHSPPRLSSVLSCRRRRCQSPVRLGVFGRQLIMATRFFSNGNYRLSLPSYRPSDKNNFDSRQLTTKKPFGFSVTLKKKWTVSDLNEANDVLFCKTTPSFLFFLFVWPQQGY